jgi:lipoyl(octanoyl) transferase
VLDPREIPVVATDRGGQVTYHGPGQAVAYVLLDLRRLGLGVKELVRRLEQAAIDMLAGYGIQGERLVGMPGVYVGGAKIAAVGLRIARGCSYHGIAVNADLDLEPFSRIDPCGFPGLASTRLADLGVAERVGAVQQSLSKSLLRCLIPT